MWWMEVGRRGKYVYEYTGTQVHRRICAGMHVSTCLRVYLFTFLPMTHILALIPARGGSKGIPRKNIRDFAGYPLIAWSIAAGLQAHTVNRVIVSTDDTEIAAVARAYGAVCTPDPFLFDVSGKLVFHGRINDAMEPEAKPTVSVMENNIRGLLSGKKIEKDFDPSVGCSIKWKS